MEKFAASEVYMVDNEAVLKPLDNEETIEKTANKAEKIEDFEKAKKLAIILGATLV